MKFKEKQKLLHLAESAALMAGNYLKNKRATWRSLKSASERDVKIRADRESERLIVQCLNDSEIPIFSEESGAIRAEQIPVRNYKAGLQWIIDPLDGSLNYHQGIPMCCVSIALYEGTRSVLGVVYDFNRDELFCGVNSTGHGAWLNYKPIQPSRTEQVARAILATGFPVRSDFSTEGIAGFVEEVQRFRKVRLLGSAALSLCYVACGRVDAYREDNIMLWDVAAGVALVRSAGGSVTMENFEQMGSPVNVTATNGFLTMDDTETFIKKRS